MKRGPKLVTSDLPHGRADGPQRAPGWWGRQARLLGSAHRVARLRRPADQIEALAVRAARRQEIVAVEAESLDAVAASLRVRAVGLEVHARAGLLDGTTHASSQGKVAG